MNDFLVILLLIFSIILFLIGLLWILVPAFYGLPSRPTTPNRVRKALKLADLQSGEVIYDLGAGDGRVLLIAAEEFGAKAVGLEVGPIQCALIWLRVAANGLGNQINIQMKNYLKADLSDADVVFLYATSREVIKIADHLQKHMRLGSRLVSISADFPEWEPTLIDEYDLIFVYGMPPKAGNMTTYMLKNAK